MGIHKRKEKKIWIQRYSGHVAMVSEIGVPRTPSRQQPPAATSSQGRGIGWLLSQSFQKESFGFLNLERINLCCFRPPSWWCFVMAALGKQFASNPQTVLGTWSPKIRLHLPAFLAAKYPSSLLPCFSQWDVSSRNMQNLSLYL